MNYVTFDNETGKLTGGFWQDLIPEHSEEFIEVTAAQRANWTKYQANAERDGVELIPENIAQEIDKEVERARLFAQIDALERETLENRGSRELSMRLLEREAASIAAQPGETRTKEFILAQVPYYVRLTQVNNTIAAIRAQIEAL